MNKNVLNYLALNLNDTQRDYDTYAAGATDYINAVWHKEELPIKDTIIIMELENSCGRCFKLAIRNDEEPLSEVERIIRWAYLEDLLPQRKEDEK